MSKTVTESIAKQIEKSKKEITILFTDIEHSTKFWDIHGDTSGRIMVDLHNKLMFPVIRQSKGTVVKTIGDSIMASFKSPDHALQAAIGMQQVLARRRRVERDIKVKIRIGIHTGKGIVEKDDVYGDMVNVAARVENAAKGSEILLSDATVSALEADRKKYIIDEKSTFLPKGKKQSVTVYACNWKRHKKLVATVQMSSRLPISNRQKVELAAFLATIAIAFYVIYAHHIRYLLADFEFVAVYILNPHPFVFWLLVLLFVGGLTFATIRVLKKIKLIPIWVLNVLKGGFGFSAVFLIVLGLAHLLPDDVGTAWDGILSQSDHLFVEVLEDNVPVFRIPSTKSKPLAKVDKGTLFLQTKRLKQNRQYWIKVLWGSDQFGYIQWEIPPSFGVAAKRLTISDKYYFRWYDLYAFLLGLLGFGWGFYTFRIRPI